MNQKNMLKGRYGNPSNKEAIQMDASAKRLSAMMKQAEISASKICEQSELKGNTIYSSNLSNYKSATRKIKDTHLDIISEVLYDALKEKGFDYNYDIFRLFLSGLEPLCDTYEEFEAIYNTNPGHSLDKYKKLFRQAGFILNYDDGFYSIVTRDGKIKETGYGDPDYSIYFNGVHKHLSPEDMETYYQKIIKYIQASFKKLKGSDSLD